jgi:hypothetical protein
MSGRIAFVGCLPNQEPFRGRDNVTDTTKGVNRRPGHRGGYDRRLKSVRAVPDAADVIPSC